MKRPVLIAVVGYILGIIMGLYFNFSIVSFYLPVILITVIIKFIKNIVYRKKIKKRNQIGNYKEKNKKSKLNIFSISRYFRYIKLVLNSKIIITIIVFSIVSNTIVLIKNHKFNNLYNEVKNVKITAIISSSKTEKNYKNTYKIKVLNLNESEKYKNTYLLMNVDKKFDLKYGDKINITGIFNSPQIARNYGGFDYKEYLKTLDVYGTVKATNVEVINHSNEGIGNLINKLQEKINENAKENLSKETYPIYLGLVLGDTSKISEDIMQQFRNSNMSHILAISGMHISYIIIGISILLNKICGKKKSKILTIFILLIYSFITGFSPSIVRASSMGIMILLSGLIHRKNDIWTSIAISLFINLISNPYLITNVGLQFSYVGTIGIIIFNKNILKILNKGAENKSKIKEIVSISLSVQLVILPLTIFHFNTFGIYFLLTNILLGFIIGPIIIVSFIFFILFICNVEIVKFIAIFLDKLIQLILLISNFGYLPMAKVYIKTPRIFEIIIYYFIIFMFNFVYSIKKKPKRSATDMRVVQIIEVCKYKIREYIKHIKRKMMKKSKNLTKLIINIILVINIFIFTLYFFNLCNFLKINFVDVGQGDCCFIETPDKKTILIDGGKSEFGNFDVGKNTLVPYILDKGYTKVDYVFISHFDTDHVGGILTVLEELHVGTAVISKQGESSQNYEKFIKIVKEKKTKVIAVEKGNRIKINNDLYFDVLWPNSSKLIRDNVLNNNSIVCKLNYKEFSMLFTGDIEELAEEQILQEYKNNLKILNSTILKVAHHGSKTSSTEEFLKVVKPKIALIGVGENNTFGHPNEQIIERLQENGVKIFRTDNDGEISIVVNRKGKIIKVKINF